MECYQSCIGMREGNNHRVSTRVCVGEKNRRLCNQTINLVIFGFCTAKPVRREETRKTWEF